MHKILPFSKARQVFKQYGLSLEQITLLHGPVIAVGGDQLTGKSTLAKRLASHYGGKHSSTGIVFRSLAQQRGLTLVQLLEQAKIEPAIDVHCDFGICSLIGSHGGPYPLVIEGRNPACMASLMQALSKRNVVKVYLKCSLAEQAIRFVSNVTEFCFNLLSIDSNFRSSHCLPLN
jgi:cytidylate kinase